MLRLVAKCGWVLEFAPETLRADREVVLAALRATFETWDDNGIFGFATPALRSDRAFVLAAIAESEFALCNAVAALRDDRSFVFEAIAAARNPERLFSVLDLRFRADRAVVMAVMASDGRPDATNAGYRVWEEAAAHERGHALQYASPDLRADREVVLAAIHRHGRALRHASAELRGDREVVLAAIQTGGKLKHAASDKMCGDREVVLAAVRKDPGAFAHAVGALRTDREILLAAGRLDWVAEALRSDRDFVLAMLRNHGCQIEHVPNALRADREVILAAVETHPWAFVYAPRALRSDRGVVLEALARSAGVLVHAQCAIDSQLLARAVLTWRREGDAMGHMPRIRRALDARWHPELSRLLSLAREEGVAGLVRRRVRAAVRALRFVQRAQRLVEAREADAVEADWNAALAEGHLLADRATFHLGWVAARKRARLA